MKCQILFSRKNKKKYFKMSSTEIFTQHANKVLMGKNENRIPYIPYILLQICQSKQCRPRSDTLKYGIRLGSTLFVTHLACL